MRVFGSFVVALLLSAAVCAAQSRVWVQPFAELDQSRTADWINRALHQSLVDELAAGGAQVLTGETRPADAEFVVSGTIQRIDNELRVTGNITDASEKTVGGFKATGSQRELFAIEDSIAQQVTNVIAPEPKVATATAPAVPAPPPAQPAAPPAPAVAAAGAPARIEAPFAPIRFGYEGSELEDAVRRGRAIEPRPVIRYQQPIYPQYAQPVYGGRYYPPYGHYGLGFRHWPSVIIIKPGHGGGGGTGAPSDNGQAIRAVSGYGGRTPPPGVINTIGGTPGAAQAPGMSTIVGGGAPGVVHTPGR